MKPLATSDRVTVRPRRRIALLGGALLLGVVRAALATGDATVPDVTPPVITGIAAAPHILWPPNGQLMPVHFGLTARDDRDPATTAAIAAVSCNEPLADGDVVPLGAMALQLRAKRSNRDVGRIYYVTVRCADAAGNTSDAVVAVTVPANGRN